MNDARWYNLKHQIFIERIYMRSSNTNLLSPILETPRVDRIRRNHGVEHATLQILSRRYPYRSMSGHSDGGGFYIVGDVSTQDVRSAVDEALTRLKAGESNLAVHPNCGTNFVISGMLVALAGFVAFFGAGSRLRDRLERIPLAASLSTLTLILANPLGTLMQREVTTSSDPGSLEVLRVTTIKRGRWLTHRVETAG